jgi:hypothetical protein
MKKFIFTIIGLSVSGAIGFAAYSYSTTGSFFLVSNNDLKVENLQVDQSELDPEIDAISQILNEAESPDADIAFPELGGEAVDGMPASGGIKIPKPKRVSVNQNLKAAQLYENPFIRFSHPAYISFKNQTLNFLEIWKEEEMIGTMNIYSNPEKLSLEDFVKGENLVDYFTESVAKGVTSEDFDIPTAKRAVKFSDYLELKQSDIYLIDLDGTIVVAKDFSSDKVVGEYLLRSIEKSN